jgi:hypothetical protein
MSGMYAMRCANGDLFAFEEQRNLRAPVFRSSRDAMCARERNLGMLPFKAVVFDEGVPGALAPTGGASGVQFWLAEGSSTEFGHGRLVDYAQPALHMHEPAGRLQ